ncbi:contactin-associated protein-like 4 isoform X1 [Tachysurus ichikawai]
MSCAHARSRRTARALLGGVAKWSMPNARARVWQKRRGEIRAPLIALAEERRRAQEGKRERERESMDLPLRAKRTALIKLALTLCCVRLSSCKADSQLSRSVAEANSSDQRLSKIYLIFGQIET